MAFRDGLLQFGIYGGLTGHVFSDFHSPDARAWPVVPHAAQVLVDGNHLSTLTEISVPETRSFRAAEEANLAYMDTVDI